MDEKREKKHIKRSPFVWISAFSHANIAVCNTYFSLKTKKKKKRKY